MKPMKPLDGLNPSFPLTLALSLEEREQPLAAPLKFVSLGAEVSRHFARRRGTFLALPAGAGLGEGNEVFIFQPPRNPFQIPP